MSVGHACREAQLVIAVVGLLTLHAHGVVLWLGMVLLALLIERNFSEDALAEFSEDLVDTFLDVCSCFTRLIFNLLCNLVTLVQLSLCECFYGLRLCCCQGVYELVARHVKHENAMLGEMVAEVVLQHEEVLL